MSELAARTANAQSLTTELAMRRTGMSFQRTRMSADRTLMAIIRTSLSLISFGFTIYQVFNKLKESGVLKSSTSAGNFGTSLVVLGVTMLVLGIIYHVAFMIGLRLARRQLQAAGLVHAERGFPPSLTLIVAVALLLIGLAAAVSMIRHIGPFG